MTDRWLKVIGGVAIAAASIGVAGCGEFVRESRSPSQLVILALEGAPGATPGEFGGTLLSDVSFATGGTINDLGQVTMRLILRDPGVPGVTSNPSLINTVTITRYRVVYRRTDGRNTPGVDVPFPFDSGVTFTVPSEGTVTAGFEIVRNTAKFESPLRQLVNNIGTIISTIAEVTFFGRDQAGNEISVTGTIGISFGQFADPE